MINPSDSWMLPHPNQPRGTANSAPTPAAPAPQATPQPVEPPPPQATTQADHMWQTEHPRDKVPPGATYHEGKDGQPYYIMNAAAQDQSTYYQQVPYWDYAKGRGGDINYGNAPENDPSSTAGWRAQFQGGGGGPGGGPDGGPGSPSGAVSSWNPSSGIGGAPTAPWNPAADKSWEGYRGPKGAVGPNQLFQTPEERTDYFEQNPMQALRSFQGQFGQGTQKRTLMSQLGDVYGKYLDHLTQTIAGGNVPRGGIIDFAEGSYEHEQPFDWTQFFHEQNPGALARASYQPSARYLY